MSVEVSRDMPIESMAGTRAPTSRPIFILGVDRSGSSLVSEITYRWGANAGDLNLLAEGNDGNPQGYWEYQPMELFVEKLFRAAKVSPWNPEFPARLRQLALDPVFRDEAKSLIDTMETEPVWFWKEPGLSLCLPFFESILVDPLFIITVRNPYESALSYEKFMLPGVFHDTIRLRALFLLRWQHFMLSILDNLSRNPNTIYLSYDQLLARPAEQCERLCAFLDRHCGRNDDNAGRVRKMTDVVNPSLWRNRSEVSLDDVDEATPAQRELFAHMLLRTREPTASFDRGLYPMAGWWSEYLENIDLMLQLVRKL